MKRHRKECRERALSLFGRKCFVCRVEEKKGKVRSNLHFHKKDGQHHESKSWELALKNPEQFVLLCFSCHRGVHFCMLQLGMAWEDIVDILMFIRKILK